MVLHVTDVSSAQLGNEEYAVWCHFCVWRIKNLRNLPVGGVQSMSWKKVWIWCNGPDNGRTDIHHRQWTWCLVTTTTEDSLCHSDAHSRQGRHICCIVYQRNYRKLGAKECHRLSQSSMYGTLIHSTSYAAQEDGFSVHHYREQYPNYHITSETTVK